MDIQVTTPTSISIEQVRVLHLEPTDVCQAACPLCARETDPEFDKDLKHSLTVDDIQRILPESVIRQLDKMFMCGNYGDPAASASTLKLYDYFRSVNNNIVLGMNTNGGIRDTEWWEQLAKRLCQPQDYVVFSIDGLADTNHVYRRNVDWHRVISNAAAFIKAGGNAHWDMLVYNHNRHQVNDCEQLARDMGFRWFRAKVSKRPLANGLEYPVGWARREIQSTVIDCHAIREKSIYIDAQGNIHPCCWLGEKQSNFHTDFNKIQASWHSTTPNPVCRAICSTENSQTNFTSQWQKNIELAP